jgi:hypothetical protein
MVPNDCGSLLHRTSVHIFKKDHAWLKDHGIEFSEFIRMVVRARLAELQALPARIPHPTVQIISYSTGQQEKGKKSTLPRFHTPIAHAGPDEAGTIGRPDRIVIPEIEHQPGMARTKENEAVQSFEEFTYLL